MTRAEDETGQKSYVLVFHTDPAATDTVTPVRSLGTPILDVVGPMEYMAVQQSFDANLPARQRCRRTLPVASPST